MKGYLYVSILRREEGEVYCSVNKEREWEMPVVRFVEKKVLPQLIGERAGEGSEVVTLQ